MLIQKLNKLPQMLRNRKVSNIKTSKGLKEYKILELLGSGNQGSVYKAENSKGEIFAIKKVLCESKKELENVKSEVRIIFVHKKIEIVMKLEHQNFVKYIDYFITSAYDSFSDTTISYVWIIMEYCNEPMDSFIQRFHQQKKTVEPKVLKKWFEQILNAFNYLHSLNIFHRDVKSSNVLFVKTVRKKNFPKTLSLIQLVNFQMN
jgi:serine/threonine protein kinase